MQNQDKLFNQRCTKCGQIISEPRTTGYRSQNSGIWGMCTSIAQQLNERIGKNTWTKNMVYNIMKRFAVADGVYPGIEFILDGVRLIEPLSQALVTKKEDSGLYDLIVRYADENNMWLWVYGPDEKKYKSIGGRTLEEMNRDYPGLNKELEIF